MNLEQINATLSKNYGEFANYIDSLSQKSFEMSKNAKWTAGQELDHILKSVRPVAQILANKEYMRSKFGESTRNSVSYEGLIAQYQQKLAEGGKSSKPFDPELIEWGKKTTEIAELQNLIKNMLSSLSNYSENELDSFCLPHPLLGLLTLREMLYFTSYHALHHLNNSQKNLEG